MEDVVARIRAEQRRHWEAGRRVPVEELLDHEPATVGSVEDMLDLVYAEVLLREEFGESPDAAEYAARFPAHADEIAKQFGVHSLFRSGSTVGPGGSTIRAGVSFAKPMVPGYELVRQVGHGAWGVVYEARQLSVGGRRVALKIVRPDRLTDVGRAMLRRDGEVAGRLSHPNIARVYDCAECGAGVYIVLELIDGGTLADRLMAGPIPQFEAASLAETVAEAVHQAHLAGVVHRDLKPSNILLTAAGVPKVSDFGLAKRLDGASSIAPDGAVVGTWQYMAPEQVAGSSSEVGPAADVWAIGAMLHEMVAGRLPFASEDIGLMLNNVRGGEPDRLPRGVASRALVAIRDKCLEKQPARRYETAADLAADLRRFLHGEPTLARPAGRVVGLLRSRIALAGLAMTTLLVALTAALIPSDPEAVPKRYSRRLQRGETVTLVGEVGPPAWHRWIGTEGRLNRSAENDGVERLEASNLALLELLPDPGVESYRVTAELATENIDDAFCRTGIYFGRQSDDGTGGLTGTSMLWLCLEDFASRPETGPTKNILILRTLLRTSRTDGAIDSYTRRIGGEVVTGKVEWRTLKIDVRPESLLASISGKSVPAVSELNITVGNRELTSREKIFGRAGILGPHNNRSRLGVWDSRAPLGIAAENGKVSFRNVSIEPLL